MSSAANIGFVVKDNNGAPTNSLGGEGSFPNLDLADAFKLDETPLPKIGNFFTSFFSRCVDMWHDPLFRATLWHVFVLCLGLFMVLICVRRLYRDLKSRPTLANWLGIGLSAGSVIASKTTTHSNRRGKKND